MDVCLCLGCGWFRWGVGRGLDHSLEGWVVLCLCELGVRILYADGRSRYLYIVFGGYLSILGTPSVQSCCTLWISFSSRVFVYGRYRKSRLVFVWLPDLDLWKSHFVSPKNKHAGYCLSLVSVEQGEPNEPRRRCLTGDLAMSIWFIHCCDFLVFSLYLALHSHKYLKRNEINMLFVN